MVLLVSADLENMAPDQVGPDEDTGVTALSNCGGTMNTVFVTVPASPFPVRVSNQRENSSHTFLPLKNKHFLNNLTVIIKLKRICYMSKKAKDLI